MLNLLLAAGANVDRVANRIIPRVKELVIGSGNKTYWNTVHTLLRSAQVNKKNN